MAGHLRSSKSSSEEEKVSECNFPLDCVDHYGADKRKEFTAGRNTKMEREICHVVDTASKPEPSSSYETGEARVLNERYLLDKWNPGCAP